MKKLLISKNTILFLCLTLIIFSCSKSESGLIVGNWTHVKTVNWYTSVSSIIQKDTIPAFPGEYIDFRTDGKEYAYFSDGTIYHHDTLNYSVNGNILTTSKNNTTGTSTLQELTSNTLNIYTKTTDSYGTRELWFFYIK